MIAERRKYMHPISEILCRTYEELRKNGQVSFPLTEEGKKALDSVIKTVNSIYFGIERFPTDEDKAVAYLVHIIKRHALTDGNKRLGLLWFQVWCDVRNLSPKEPVFGYDALAIAIEATEPDELDKTIKIVQSILF
ncbi:MAG: Fic family protein [Patescibacteria group bacterium]